jgi:hypothetical protein
MPDDARAAFAQAAMQDGMRLEPATFDFLSEQGHVGLERIAKARRDPAVVEPVKRALTAIAAIYARLNGDVSVLGAARENLLLPVDMLGGRIIAIDGPEHFTSFRLMTLGLYPEEAPVGFDRDEWGALCREHAPRSDRLGRGLAAKGFGFGGVQRERAYHDALADLAMPAMGHPPLIRVAAPDGDGAAAYERLRNDGS